MTFMRGITAIWAAALLAFVRALAWITPLFGHPIRKVAGGYQLSLGLQSNDLVGLCLSKGRPVYMTVSACSASSVKTVVVVGLFHQAALELDLTDQTGSVLFEVADDRAVEIILLAENVFTSALIAAWYLAVARSESPLQIIRRCRVTFGCPDELNGSLSAAFDRFAPNTLVHFRHLIELAAKEGARFDSCRPVHTPLISFVVPVYNAPTNFLDDLLSSFQLQAPGLGELILCDDASTQPATRNWLSRHTGRPNIRIVLRDRNGGIASATNAGIAVSLGRWIGFVDHDDALAPFAVSQIARALAENPDCQFLYSDEVLSNEALALSEYFLKPAWDPVLLSGVNYVNHLSLYRRDRLQQVGLLRSDFDGSQDYELLLRYTQGLKSSEVLHLPYPAYIWRRSKTTYSARFLARATDNARRAIAATFGHGRAVKVEAALSPDLHRVRYDVATDVWPLVSVIIPNKDAPALIRQLLKGVFDETDYPKLEVIIVDNGTSDPDTLRLYQEYKAVKKDVIVNILHESFNFSRSINRGTSLSHGDFILFLNNDIEICDRNWLKEMVSCFQYEDVGIVGAKLLYPTRKLQHAGVIAGLGGYAGHWFIGLDEAYPGPMGRLWVRQQFSCVTGACMLVSRTCLETVGALDEINFAIAYNDIDFGLRARKAGFRIVWTPFACLLHHESASRGSDETPQNIERFEREKANLKRLYGTDRYDDPTINPWYSRGNSAPRPILRTTLPLARRR